MDLDDISISIRKKYQLHFYIALVTLVGLLILGTVVFKYVENWSWVDAFYYSVSTISTVGYGDHTPMTDLGKIAASIFILVSVPLILYAFYIFAKVYFDQRIFKVISEEKKIEDKIEEKIIK